MDTAKPTSSATIFNVIHNNIVPTKKPWYKLLPVFMCIGGAVGSMIGQGLSFLLFGIVNWPFCIGWWIGLSIVYTIINLRAGKNVF